MSLTFSGETKQSELKRIDDSQYSRGTWGYYRDGRYGISSLSITPMRDEIFITILLKQKANTFSVGRNRKMIIMNYRKSQ